MDLMSTDFRFNRFLRGIVGMFQIRVQQKAGVTFSYDKQTDLPSVVHADEKRLCQILINLLGNAIKFTDKGDVIFRVKVLEKGDEPTTQRTIAKIRFEVEDTGVGIAPEQMERIFWPFEQVGHKRYHADGTGYHHTEFGGGDEWHNCRR